MKICVKILLDQCVVGGQALECASDRVGGGCAVSSVISYILSSAKSEEENIFASRAVILGAYLP